MNKTSAESIHVLPTLQDVFLPLVKGSTNINNIHSQSIEQFNESNQNGTPTTATTATTALTPTKSPADSIKGSHNIGPLTYVFSIIVFVGYAAAVIFGSKYIFHGLGFGGFVLLSALLNFIVLGITLHHTPSIKKNMSECVGEGGFGRVKNSEETMIVLAIILLSICCLIAIAMMIYRFELDQNLLYGGMWAVMLFVMIGILLAGGIYLKAVRCEKTDWNDRNAFVGTLIFTFAFNWLNFLYLSLACLKVGENSHAAMLSKLPLMISIMFTILTPTYWGSLNTVDQDETNDITAGVGGGFGGILIILLIIGLIKPDWSFPNF